MYVTYCGPYGWQVIRIDGRHATLIAAAIDQEHAIRIAELLDRNGLIDMPLSAVEA